MGNKLKIQSSGTYTVANDTKVKVDSNQPITATIAGDGGPMTKLNLDFEDLTQADKIILDVSTFGPGPLKITLKGYDAVDALQLPGGTLTGVDPANPDTMTFTFTDATGTVQTGSIRLKGNVKNWNNSPLVICFAAGAMIDTPHGEIPVEALQIGDMVRTWDGCILPVKWIGSRHLSWWDLALHPHLRPVRVFAGALGRGLPRRDLVVSPQHRVMLEGAKIELCFAAERVLVPAISLVDGVHAESETELDSVSYYHVLLDGHHILRANGAPAESLLLADQARNALTDAQTDEISALFCDLAPRDRPAQTACELALQPRDARVAARQQVA
ncbi:MAG: hypothetical protein AUK37_08700 [Rhodobacterales bacterium CG2_30_65_12]|nr:MAG: hypothetical protein AUK37_08700 [Rhodobacterales bacterium CG2_30_65_12]